MSQGASLSEIIVCSDDFSAMALWRQFFLSMSLYLLLMLLQFASNASGCLFFVTFDGFVSDNRGWSCWETLSSMVPLLSF